MSLYGGLDLWNCLKIEHEMSIFFCCICCLSAKDDKRRLVRFCSSVTPLPDVRLKVAPVDDIQLLFPVHFNGFFCKL